MLDPAGTDFAETVLAEEAIAGADSVAVALVVVAFAGVQNRNLVSCQNYCGIHHHIACSSYSAR